MKYHGYEIEHRDGWWFARLNHQQSPPFATLASLKNFLSNRDKQPMEQRLPFQPEKETH